jgi:hypothetical protein
MLRRASPAADILPAMRVAFLPLLLAAAGPAACQRPASLPYDLARPDRTFLLPGKLREISALTCVDEHTIACVQDEKGTLFVIDVRDGQLRGSHRFGPKGDYEGLARASDGYYVLRSDRTLLRLVPRGTSFAIAETIALDIPRHDLEGLCFDPARGILLVAPKDVARPEPDADGGLPGKAARRELKNERVLWGFDLKTRELLAEPVLRLSVPTIVAQAGDSEELPSREDKKGRPRPDLELRFSCVAVHPQTNDIWLLSSADHLLLVVNRAGALQHLHRLDAKVFPKPEGMTFLPDGSFVLSSEGADGPAQVCIYRRRAD